MLAGCCTPLIECMCCTGSLGHATPGGCKGNTEPFGQGPAGSRLPRSHAASKRLRGNNCKSKGDGKFGNTHKAETSLQLEGIMQCGSAWPGNSGRARLCGGKESLKQRQMAWQKGSG